jgi:hemolysin activation/secretion protein
VGAQYSRSDSPLIDESLADLEIESLSESIGFYVEHPFVQNVAEELTIGVLGEWRESETFLLGNPFTLSAGAENGRSRVAALRVYQEFVRRDVRQIWAWRSTFSVGAPVLGATEHGDREPDGEFLAWLGQVRHESLWGESSNRLVLAGSLQLADDALLSLEQIGLGGRHSVRGYRENQFIRDNALIGTIGLMIPVLFDASGDAVFTLEPFVDAGWGWDTNRPHRTESIVGAGLGFSWEVNDRLSMEFHWAHGFTEIDNPGYDLQDDGLHFGLFFRVW